MNIKNSNPYYVSNANVIHNDDEQYTEIFGLEVDLKSGIGTITSTHIYKMPNRYKNQEGHIEREFFTHVFFYDDETIIDYPWEISDLIDLCKNYNNNPIKFQVL